MIKRISFMRWRIEVWYNQSIHIASRGRKYKRKQYKYDVDESKLKTAIKVWVDAFRESIPLDSFLYLTFIRQQKMELKASVE